MSDIFTVTTRVGSDGSMQYVGKAAGNVEFAIGEGFGLPQAVTKTITAAQIKALHGTPVTIIPAAGAGTFIDVTSILWDFQYTSPQFTSSIGILGLYWGAGGQAVGSGLASAALIAAANALQGDAPIFPAASPGWVTSTVLNTAVVLQNPSATEYTAGNGSLIVRVGYRIISGLA